MNTKTTFNVCYSEDHDNECNILSIIRAKMKRNKGVFTVDAYLDVMNQVREDEVDKNNGNQVFIRQG